MDTSDFSVDFTEVSTSITFAAPSTDSSLKSLTISGVALTKSGNTYTGSVPYATSSVTINAVPNDANATVSGTGAFSLIVGENTKTVTVTAQAGGSNKTDYTVKITRAEGDKDASLSEVKLTKGDTTYTLEKLADGSYALAETDVIEYGDKDGWSISATATSSKATVSGTGAVSLDGGENTCKISVTPEQGDAVEYTVKITVANASTDTTLTGDPQVYAGTEKLQLNLYVPEIRLYTLKYPAGTSSLRVEATPTDPTATVEIYALKLDNDTPMATYAPSEEIELDGVERLRVVVTAQSGTPTTYTIMLYEEKGSTAGDGEDEAKFVTIDFGDGTLEIGKGDTETEYAVKKGVTRLEFTITVIDGVTVEVLYGASEADTEEASVKTLVAYAEESADGGTAVKYVVELTEGNNPILLKVNESGIAGDDVIYALNVTRGAGGSDVGWIIAVVLLSVFLAAAVAALVVIIIKDKKDGGDGAKKNTDEAEETTEVAEATETTEAVEEGKDETAAEEPTEEPKAEETAEPEQEVAESAESAESAEVTEVAETAEAAEEEKDETAAEEPTEEPKPEEATAEPEQEAAESAEESAEVTEVTEAAEDSDGNEGVQIRRIQTHREKYENLSHEQRVFYDELKLRALAIPGAMLNVNKSNETIRCGQKRVMKLTIRRDFVIACFFAENENVTNLRKAMRGKDIRITTRETEIPIYDVRAFEAACEMLQIIIDGMQRK